MEPSLVSLCRRLRENPSPGAQVEPVKSLTEALEEFDLFEELAEEEGLEAVEADLKETLARLIEGQLGAQRPCAVPGLETLYRGRPRNVIALGELDTQ